MPIRLRVVSDHQRRLGARGSATFDATGGTIGRAAENDWVLPDPQRYLSSRHARIHCRHGHFYLEDTSTNGVFVNDSEQPLGRHAQHQLCDGDLLRLGDYRIVVALDEAAEVPSDQSAVVAVERIERAASPVQSTQGDLGEPLSLQSLLEVDPEFESSLGAVNAFGQAVEASFGRTRVDGPDAAEAAAARRLARAVASVRERPSTAAFYDVATGLQAFCRGAGIEAEQLPAEAQTRLLHLVGQLFREALLGLKDLGRSQRELRNRFRIEMAREPDDPRSSLERATVEELLLRLLSSHEMREIDAVQWLRDEFLQAKLHDGAVAQAMRAAFAEFVGRLDPGELDTRFERAAHRGRLAANKSQHWTLYAEFYRNLTEMPADHLPHLFVEAFGRTYLEALEPRE